MGSLLRSAPSDQDKTKVTGAKGATVFSAFQGKCWFRNNAGRKTAPIMLWVQGMANVVSMSSRHKKVTADSRHDEGNLASMDSRHDERDTTPVGPRPAGPRHGKGSLSSMIQGMMKAT